MVYKMCFGSGNVPVKTKQMDDNSGCSGNISRSAGDGVDDVDVPQSQEQQSSDSFDALFRLTSRLTIAYYLGAMQGLQATAHRHASALSLMTQTLSMRILRLVENYNDAMAADRAIAQDMFYALTWAEGRRGIGSSASDCLFQLFSIGVMHSISFSPEVLMREKKWAINKQQAQSALNPTGTETSFSDYMLYSDMRTELDGIHQQMLDAM